MNFGKEILPPSSSEINTELANVNVLLVNSYIASYISCICLSHALANNPCNNAEPSN